MRYFFVIVFLVALAGSGCLDDNTSGVGETVTIPDRPAGPDTVLFGHPNEFRSGGAVSSKDHALEYRFDFDAAGSHDYSGWRTEPVVTKSWPDSGLYQVKAQARCAEHPGNASPRSPAKIVRVNLGAIGIPATPTGPAILWTVETGVYCTGGVTGNDIHPVQYRFDFDAEGGHAYSAWLDTTCAGHNWSYAGIFVIKAQARFANDPDVLSPWSAGLDVAVNQYTLPKIHFATAITRIGQNTSVTTTKPYLHGVLDTVGVCRPLSISYHGTSTWFPIQQYQFFPMSLGVTIDGQREWTTDLADTIQDVDLCGNSYYNGVFRLAAQCEDAAEGRSIIDPGQFEYGVCQVVVNFDPDTKITQLLNTYFVNQQPVQRWIDFEDAVPDTVPFRSWVTLFYRGWDSPFDSSFCQDPVNQCIKYQKSFHRTSERFPYAVARTSHLPESAEDNDPFNLADTTSMNFGSVEYEVYVRSLDEHDRPDGTPASVELVGNFDPVLDGCYLSDHSDNHIENGDTITWNWWRPANTDTFNSQTMEFEKKFQFIVNASGHDHPMEPQSGVKNWLYNFYDPQSVFIRFARAGAWVPGIELNVLSDTFAVTFSYPLTDPAGASIFENLPDWLDTTYDLVLKGRDTEIGEDFRQYMFINSEKVLINAYPVSNLGRWTEERTIRFHLRLVQ